MPHDDYLDYESPEIIHFMEKTSRRAQQIGQENKIRDKQRKLREMREKNNNK